MIDSSLRKSADLDGKGDPTWLKKSHASHPGRILHGERRYVA